MEKSRNIQVTLRITFNILSMPRTCRRRGEICVKFISRIILRLLHGALRLQPSSSLESAARFLILTLIRRNLLRQIATIFFRLLYACCFPLRPPNNSEKLERRAMNEEMRDKLLNFHNLLRKSEIHTVSWLSSKLTGMFRVNVEDKWKV
jgi:hypothetical protein